MKAKEFINREERPVITIGPDESARSAIEKLVEHNIGALPVCDAKGAMLGIITERDLLKECSQRLSAIGRTKVKNIMTEEVAVGTCDDDVNYIMSVMTQMKIRHLPIMKGLTLEGMVSARDIMESQLEQTKANVRYLREYIELLEAILQKPEPQAEG
jgi:CBS-domain-containing membrane protein